MSVGRSSALLPCRTGVLALACALLAGAVWAQSSAEQGLRIMVSGTLGNCVACHSLPGQTGVGSNFGPSLFRVGTRYNADELRQWVTDARLVKPDTLMPPFGTTQGTKEPIRAQSILSSDEIGHVVAALQTLR
jgi:L-cysteine S-thiosulfotransferase